MSSRTKLLVPTLIFLALLLAAGIYLRRISVRPVRELPRMGAFPAFALPDASGRVWRNADLRGSIWIAGSFAASCADCATLALKMTDLQSSLERARGVVLVSFVSDPALRSPLRLAELAREFGARPGRWVLLSGPAAIPIGRVVLVDREGSIRGKFDAATPGFASDVLDAVGDVLREEGNSVRVSRH